VILTAITSPELASTLVQLKRHERQITLYTLAEEAPQLMPGIRIIHQPFKPSVAL
jgi:hypothetical protein